MDSLHGLAHRIATTHVAEPWIARVQGGPRRLLRTPAGLQVISHCLECDVRRLCEHKMMRILKAFWQAAEIDDDGLARLLAALRADALGTNMYTGPTYTVTDVMKMSMDENGIVTVAKFIGFSFSGSGAMLSGAS